MHSGSDTYIRQLRRKVLLADEQRILVARLGGSEQEKDLSSPVNCQGYGRIRHFEIHKFHNWSSDPLPNLPAARSRNLTSPEEVMRAQVFQIAGCNWRCWYCFVDDELLSADHRFSAFFTASELVDMFLAHPDHPYVLDLTGGYPDLVPEWVLWTMKALVEKGAEKEVFLWSDDNLSSRALFQFLVAKDIDYMLKYEKYSRVGCFKGYDEASFIFNTLAPRSMYRSQFVVFSELLALGLDMYAYVTFTSKPRADIKPKMREFVDDLQQIHPNLPLRTVPLRIEAYSPTRKRMSEVHSSALEYQHVVHETWKEEIASRYSEDERAILISEVPLKIRQQ